MFPSCTLIHKMHLPSTICKMLNNEVRSCITKTFNSYPPWILICKFCLSGILLIEYWSHLSLDHDPPTMTLLEEIDNKKMNCSDLRVSMQSVPLWLIWLQVTYKPEVNWPWPNDPGSIYLHSDTYFGILLADLIAFLWILTLTRINIKQLQSDLESVPSLWGSSQYGTDFQHQSLQRYLSTNSSPRHSKYWGIWLLHQPPITLSHGGDPFYFSCTFLFCLHHVYYSILSTIWHVCTAQDSRTSNA